MLRWPIRLVPSRDRGLAEGMIEGLTLIGRHTSVHPHSNIHADFDEPGCWGDCGKFPNSRAHLQALDNRGRYTK
jgi:hypothetical protein